MSSKVVACKHFNTAGGGCITMLLKIKQITIGVTNLGAKVGAAPLASKM